ncbi:MAG: helix-turn-helix domain-containing protein [Bacillota bacterium]
MENKFDTIGKRLQAIRVARNLQPKDVNETTGISLGNLHALEHDKTKPSADALIKLAKLYNVTADWILFGEAKGEDGAKNDGLSVPVSNLELAVIFSRIAEVWERGDEETKAWVVVQLRRAFPEVMESMKKKT